MKSDALLQLSNVGKSFQRDRVSRAVLESVSLDLQRGQLVTLRGENGAGKTTLLRIAAGILPPDFGTVRVAKRCLPFARSVVALALGNDPRFNARLTVADHLKAQSYAYGLNWKECLGEAEPLAEKLLLDGGLTSRLSQVSDGTRAKISLLRALVVKPQVLLLDEPTAALSPHACQALRGILEERREHGAIFIATHDRDFGWNTDANVREFALVSGRLVEHRL